MNVILESYPPVQKETEGSLLTKRKLDEDEADVSTRQKV
jgi:hypothetical protein